LSTSRSALRWMKLLLNAASSAAFAMGWKAVSY
jgi:hypothetical protein